MYAKQVDKVIDDLKENSIYEDLKNNFSSLYYMEVARVPSNISYKVLYNTCKTVGVYIEKTKITKVFEFYGPTEESLRYVRTRLLTTPENIHRGEFVVKEPEW